MSFNRPAAKNALSRNVVRLVCYSFDTVLCLICYDSLVYRAYRKCEIQ